MVIDKDDSLEKYTNYLKKISILVVDENVSNQKLISKCLDDDNVELTFVSYGKECLNRIRNNEKYDLILMDIMMPVMDGLEAARQIRAMDRPDAKLIPIVAMSANAFQDDVERSKKAGMNKHISKPLTGESVIREIKSML